MFIYSRLNSSQLFDSVPSASTASVTWLRRPGRRRPEQRSSRHSRSSASSACNSSFCFISRVVRDQKLRMSQALAHNLAIELRSDENDEDAEEESERGCAQWRSTPVWSDARIGLKPPQGLRGPLGLRPPLSSKEARRPGPRPGRPRRPPPRNGCRCYRCRLSARMQLPHSAPLWPTLAHSVSPCLILFYPYYL